MMIKDVLITKLDVMEAPGGGVMHAMKETSIGYGGFGEAYFSQIDSGAIKAWKRHREMTLNLIVPLGKIKFVLFDDRGNSNTVNNFFSVKLSPTNYNRLTVPPGIWHAFKGHNYDLNLILDISDIKHQQEEIVRVNIDDIPFEWESL